MINKGLTGYFFKDDFFSDLSLIAPSHNDSLGVEKNNLPSCLLNQKIKAVRWFGTIKMDISGDYIFSSDSKNYIIQINGEVVNQAQAGIQIKLQKDLRYNICIEELLETPVILNRLKEINLYYSLGDNTSLVPNSMLLNTDFSDTTSRIFMPKENLFNNNPKTRDLKPKDSDNDGIPDEWEIGGYTVINGLISKWDDSFEGLGYEKYVSNPFSARTSGDPYTDAEKVSGQIDKSISQVARNPMIAAYPIIGVQIEKLVVSKNQTISSDQTQSMSKNVSTSSGSSDTAGTSISVEVGYGAQGFTGGVSATANYSHTWQTSNTIADSNGTSFSNGLSFNESQVAYINPNIRYYNSGTAPVYELSPNITLGLNGYSIVTVQSQQNNMASFLNPANSYPKSNIPPIAFNTMDQFNSHLIPISKTFLNYIDSGKPIEAYVNRFNGQFGKIDILTGKLNTVGNEWGPYLGQIESSTASLTLSKYNELPKEIRIAAKNKEIKNDTVPNMTIREAIKKVFNLEEINSKMYLNSVEISGDTKIAVIMDSLTKATLDIQLRENGKDNFLDCNLEAKMNILFKILTKKLEVACEMDCINDYNIRPEESSFINIAEFVATFNKPIKPNYLSGQDKGYSFRGNFQITLNHELSQDAVVYKLIIKGKASNSKGLTIHAQGKTIAFIDIPNNNSSFDKEILFTLDEPSSYIYIGDSFITAPVGTAPNNIIISYLKLERTIFR